MALALKSAMSGKQSVRSDHACIVACRLGRFMLAAHIVPFGHAFQTQCLLDPSASKPVALRKEAASGMPNTSF